MWSIFEGSLHGAAKLQGTRDHSGTVYKEGKALAIIARRGLRKAGAKAPSGPYPIQYSACQLIPFGVTMSANVRRMFHQIHRRFTRSANGHFGFEAARPIIDVVSALALYPHHAIIARRGLRKANPRSGFSGPYFYQKVSHQLRPNLFIAVPPTRMSL